MTLFEASRYLARNLREQAAFNPSARNAIDAQSALQDEIRALRDRDGTDSDPAGRAFASLADAYRRAGDLDEAWERVTEGLDRHPEFATGHLVAARIARDREDLAGARESYERVLALDPENAEALREAAALARSEGRTVDALRHLQKLSFLDPFDMELREELRELKERHFDEAADIVDPDGASDVAAMSEDAPRSPLAEGGPADAHVVADDSASRASAPDAWPAAPAAEEGSGESETDDASPMDTEVQGMADEVEAAMEVGEAATGSVGRSGSGEEEAPDEEDEDGEESEVLTRTMAELYVAQGHPERALKVYERLLRRSPDDPDLRARVLELEGRESKSEDGVTVSAYFRSLLSWEGDSEASGPGGEEGDHEQPDAPGRPGEGAEPFG